MRLIKEHCIEKDSNGIDSIGYVKLYDNRGNLTYHSEYHTYDGVRTEYFFSENNKITKEKIFIDKSYGDADEEREKIYEYNESGYRILEYQTKIIDDSRTAPQFAKGGLIMPDEIMNKYPRDVNNLLSIEDVKTVKGKITRRKIFNLISNDTVEIEYQYENDLLIREATFEIYKSDKTITREIIKNFNKNKKIISEKIIDYKGSEKLVDEHLIYEYPEIENSRIPEMAIVTNQYGTRTTNYYDNKGNIFQSKNQYSDRTIYINNYNGDALIECVKVDIHEDSHTLISTTKYFYEE